MQSKTLRQAMIWLALLIVGSCQLPVANAQTSDPAPAHKVKQSKRIHITVSTADPQNGIAGFVINEKTGIKINFQSKRIGDGVTAQITDKDGHTLIEYIEAKQEVVVNPSDGTTVFEMVPWLRLNGIQYEGYKGQVVDEMKSIASSPEADLIRRLAFYLVFYAPGEDLEPERRGLEVPYQALQRFYDVLYNKSAGGEFGKQELEAASQLRRPLPASATIQHTGSHEADFILVPEGCKMPECAFVDSHDYQLSGQGGFVVKSLSPRMALSHNYARPDTIEHDEDVTVMESASSDRDPSACSDKPQGKSLIRPMDDPNQVGNCFGRCGAGCGGWTHEWVGSPNVIQGAVSCMQGYRNPYMDIMCVESCEEQSISLDIEYGTAVHTAHGRVTPASIAHDACVRSSPLGVATPWCQGILLDAVWQCFGPLFFLYDWDETWSYVGYHEQQVLHIGWDPWFCREQMSDCCRAYY